MANYFLCLLIFRIALPILLSVCILFRPSGLSALYMLLLFYLPLVPVPTSHSLSGHTGIYLKILIAISVITSLCQIAFQIVLFATGPYGSILKDCELLEKALRHAGFVKLDATDAITITTWLSPEILMLLSSVGTFVLCRKITLGNTSDPEEGSELDPTKKAKKRHFGLLIAIGRYVVLITLCLAAVLRPSVQGGLYFLIFLTTATWWACYKQLRRGFAMFCRCIMVIVAFHMSILYLYQFQWFQEVLPPETPYPRYFGLTPIYNVTCEGDPRVFHWVKNEIANYINPIALFWLYYILALESKALLKPQLIRSVSPSNKRFGSGKKSNSRQESGSSTAEHPEDIPLELLEEEYSPTVFERAIFIMEYLLQVIIKSSYIATNIIMMAWSITYISWITFVLLLWANLLWLVPNQRKQMLRSSPFLVIYAWFLLISAYIYSMKLTEDELPSNIQGYNLAQIGFEKITYMPCNPLLVKCLFTAMFWITLRQFMQERIAARESHALADMVAPLQVTVGTATGMSKEKEKGNRTMERVGDFLKKFLTKFWIWVVAVTLFAVAITGQRMTGFRILYMALFLFFVITFQVSFRFWRRMMFAFWLTVIIYSMIILVMVYTYQFDNFENYWKDYLHVPIQQQLDIGLEKFQTKQLFVRLVTPTFFVIITVIQLHYFHKDFMELSDPKNIAPITLEVDNSSLQGGGALIDVETDKDITSTTVTTKYDTSECENDEKKRFRKMLKSYTRKYRRVMDLFFLFLELHMPKVVLFFAMLLCVYDKCALYLIIVILISLSFTIGRSVQIFSIYSSSILVSVILLSRMIYQIQYIDDKMWNVTCQEPNGNTTKNVTLNDAEWLGFDKSDDNTGLPGLLKWNIIYIIVITVWAVVLVRQFNYRVARGKPQARAFFMFPKVSRTEADKNLRNCIKYLFNYGFYKFGVEMSFMSTVALIGFRMDFYAVIYSVWLVGLISLKRATLSKIWIFYLWFVALILPVQYFMVVGLPPSLCIEYPWNNNEILRRLQEWAFLMDTDYPPSPKKLICDFVVLLFVSRQSVVFRIEARHRGKDYAGGSNDSIIHLAEDKNFVNPVPDFITFVRSYLDIFKRGILMSFLWITLAIVFLAGTNRVNIFSIGYLLGAFVFLWQGSDLYLRPIPKILQAWNWLIGYNVVIILIKTILQIVGCIFIQEIADNSCWIIQILGIGCVKKFGNVVVAAGLTDHDECRVPREFVGLVWDGICFGFLIMQKRIFQSYNFFHIIDEAKVTTILASRGAELIEELSVKRVLEKEEEEKRILEKIKAKMDKIKATQQKIQGASYKDPTSHYVDSIFKGRPKYRRRPPKTYKEAIRSGDYYMFDDLDDEDVDFELEVEKPGDAGDVDLQSKQPKISEVTDSKIGPIEECPEPKPGTSKDEELSDISEPKNLTLLQKIFNMLRFIWVFIESCMTSLTLCLNRRSKDYRYVIKVLTKEKKILKEKTEYSSGIRVGSSQLWQPADTYMNLLSQSQESRSYVPQFEDLDRTEMSSYDQPVIVRLLLAIWYTVMSNSQLLCYFIIFLNQIKSATFLSLPLPLMVFFWGSMTIPRPSKNFWITIIAYTEIIVLVKCMFQFDIIPWNRNQAVYSNPFYNPPAIIGIERTKNYAVYDLLLLLVVFFHRFMLKSLGLWKSSVIQTAVLAKGSYEIDKNGKALVPVSASSPKKSSSTDENSDLKQLVEEGEDTIDEDTSVEESSKQVAFVTSEDQVANFESVSQRLKESTSKYAEAFKDFFKHLMDPNARVANDVYSYMFLCDFFNFFVILIGYSSFGTQQGDGGVSSYLEENRVPVLFLLMLILQFMLIVIDRGIFLRKNIIAKIIFQFLQIILLHVWLFVIFPIITERQFNSVLPPQIYYMVKCFYLLLSAYQIRCGYPTRILGNFLCKGYNYVNMFLFKGFMLIPFLFELRTVMDWMWTDTSMTVFDWIKMEDIFAHIFQLKCSRHIEDEYPQPRGEKKKSLVKYFMGGGILAVIIGIIWFPLVFFSLGNAVGDPNVPYDVTIQLRIGPYEPVYQMSAQSNSIYSFKQNDYDNLLNIYLKDKYSVSFISNYEPSDIAAVKLSTDSANIWSISPPDRVKMVEEVNSTNPVTVRLDYKVSHKTSNPEDSGVIPDNVEVVLEAGTAEEPNVVRQNLLKMLTTSNANSTSVLLSSIMPKFLKVTNRGTAKPISRLMRNIPGAIGKYNELRNVTLSLSNSNSGGNLKEWWHIQETCDDNNYNEFLKNLPYNDKCQSIVMYTFNDKIFSASLNIITGGGIIGLYTTLVLVASRLLRGFFAEQCFKIMFEDMPNVDRVLQLCLDIYLVREAREFALEEDLFAKLVFLFRSPETLIKWTRPKEELADDEDPEGDE